MNAPYKKLKAYRQLTGMNQSEFGKTLGISLSNYNSKENGKTPFTLEEAKKISEYFQTTIDEVFFKDDVNF